MEAFAGFMGQLPVQYQSVGWEQQMIAARPSDDDQSINSDGTEVLASCSGFSCRAVHRGRKGIPHRAPMYGTHGASAADSQAQCPNKACSKPSRPDRRPLSSSSTGAAAAAAAAPAAKPSSIAAGSKGMKKTANPQQGPCDNCGTYVSPQWRHGSKYKPTVCNACGIRFLRTGSFDKQDKRRPGTFAPGGRQPKRSRGDEEQMSTEPEDDELEPHIGASHHHPDFHPVSSRHAAAAAKSRSCTPPAGAAAGRMVATAGGNAGGLPGGDWLQAAAAAAAAAAAQQQQLPAPGSNGALMPPPQQVGKHQQYNSQQQQQLYCSGQQYSQPLPLPRLQSLSPAESPASTGTAFNPGSTPPSPLALDGAAVSSFQGAVSSRAAHNTGGVASTEARPAQQQQQGQVQQQHGRAAAGGHGPSRLGAAGSSSSSSRPTRFGATAQAAGMGAGSTSNAMMAPAGMAAAAAAAAGSAPALGMVPSPDLLQLVARLAGTLGSVDAAIAFIKNLHTKQQASLPGSAAGAGAAGGAAAAGAAGMQSLGGM